MSATVSISGSGKSHWWQNRTFRRFARHRLAMLGLIMITVLTPACVFGPYFLPFDELFIDLRARFAPPLAGYHIFGTDPLGRDLAARLFMAGRISLLVGFFAMLLSTIFGTVIIAVTSWMEIARIVEAEVRSLRERDFVLAARMLGLSNSWIKSRELLPNAIGPIIVAATLTVARAILPEAYVSFLGYGIQPPLPSWGSMLNGAQQYLDRAPWLAIVPGVAITLAVTSFNFIGDGLRDALDARSDLN